MPTPAPPNSQVPTLVANQRLEEAPHAWEAASANQQQSKTSIEPRHAWETFTGPRPALRRPVALTPSRPFPYDDYAKATGRVHIQDEGFHIIAPAPSQSPSPILESAGQTYADQMYIKSSKRKNSMQKLAQDSNHMEAASLSPERQPQKLAQGSNQMEAASLSPERQPQKLAQGSNQMEAANMSPQRQPQKLAQGSNQMEAANMSPQRHPQKLAQGFTQMEAASMSPQRQPQHTTTDGGQQEEPISLAASAEPLRQSQQELGPCPPSEEEILRALAATYDKALLVDITSEMVAYMTKPEVVAECNRSWTHLLLEVPQDMPHFMRHLITFKNGLETRFSGILPSPPPALRQVVKDLRVLSDHNQRRRMSDSSTGASQISAGSHLVSCSY
ncbi:hypothetical protein HDU86_008392 [Geranomyces michiganensis]|nr:hypothetical protein HDU86_008392 [Geranomyces michiganensis]